MSSKSLHTRSAAGHLRDAARVLFEAAEVVEPRQLLPQRFVRGGAGGLRARDFLKPRAEPAEQLLLEPVAVVVALARGGGERERVRLGRGQPAPPRRAVDLQSLLPRLLGGAFVMLVQPLPTFPLRLDEWGDVGVRP